MAIYSCNVASIGKSTHAEGTAGAHLSYIGRDTAAPVILCEHMPHDPARARSWMDGQEGQDRKNARLGDKIRLALPREMTAEQRAELVQDFMDQLGQGRVPWYAGIHQQGEDAHNPHAHIFVRDRDIDTGKRVLRLSDSSRDREKAGLEPKAVEWVRERWESVCNDHLDRANIVSRIDRRTLEAQGIERTPTIHIGPRAQHIEKNVQRPTSRKVTDGRGREIDYPYIDAGRTRLERHAEIIDMNTERDIRSADPKTRAWAKWEKEQRGLDRALERNLCIDARRRTMERRRAIGAARKRFQELRSDQDAETRSSIAKVRGTHSPARLKLQERQKAERRDLVKKESTVFRRVAVMLDFTGIMKRRRDEARKTLARIHTRERREFSRGYKVALKTQIAAVAAKYGAARQDIVGERDTRMSGIRERHREAETAADNRRQDRERDRERDRVRMDMAVRIWGRTSPPTAGQSPGVERGRGGPSPA